MQILISLIGLWGLPLSKDSNCLIVFPLERIAGCAFQPGDAGIQIRHEFIERGYAAWEKG
jgi:hypothetical protein